MEDIVYFPGTWELELIGKWRSNMHDFEGSMSFGSEFPRGIFEVEMSCFKPHLISYFPGDESMSRSG